MKRVGTHKLIPWKDDDVYYQCTECGIILYSYTRGNLAVSAHSDMKNIIKDDGTRMLGTEITCDEYVIRCIIE